jgi:hypothetical protein
MKKNFCKKTKNYLYFKKNSTNLNDKYENPTEEDLKILKKQLKKNNFDELVPKKVLKRW